MLQIATGKLFARPVRLENQLRGVLHTNARLGRDEAVETAAGKLLPASDGFRRPQAVVYEFVERIEIEAVGPAFFISSGVEPYLQDFAVAASFALNCTFSPNLDLTRRLTSGERGLTSRLAPNHLVRRFFDAEVFCQPAELQFLTDFMEQLIGLRRSTFMAVMRALRTYISGMHRIADDVELAYTLLVASVESLAQEFDGHQTDWESLDETKRAAMDRALEGADDDVANRVRARMATSNSPTYGRANSSRPGRGDSRLFFFDGCSASEARQAGGGRRGAVGKPRSPQGPSTGLSCGRVACPRRARLRVSPPAP